MVIVMWVVFAIAVIAGLFYYSKGNTTLKSKVKDGDELPMPRKKRIGRRMISFAIAALSLYLAIELKPSKIIPYDYVIMQVSPADFAGATRTVVKIVIPEDALDPKRIKTTAYTAAQNSGRPSKTYTVYIYDRVEDLNSNYTVGSVVIGKWDVVTKRSEPDEIYTMEERSKMKKLADLVRRGSIENTVSQEP